jgi:hypothetical protein
VLGFRMEYRARDAGAILSPKLYTIDLRLSGRMDDLTCNE